MIVNLISVIPFFILFTLIVTSNQNENGHSQYICLEYSESEFDINGNSYCLKCDENKGYIGIAGTCIPKDDFPSKKIIDNCQSYSLNVAYCAVCNGNNRIKITKSCENKDKLPMWIFFICVFTGILIIGSIIMVIVVVKQRRKKSKLKEKDNNDNENMKNNNIQNITKHNNIQSDNLPLPREQVLEEERLKNEDEFHFSDKYHCSKNGCNGKAVIKSDCNCGCLCLEHAISFYNSNNLNSFNRKKSLNIIKQQCKECNIGFINEIKRLSNCEMCGMFEFLEPVENKEICKECTGKLLENL